MTVSNPPEVTLPIIKDRVAGCGSVIDPNGPVQRVGFEKIEPHEKQSARTDTNRHHFESKDWSKYNEIKINSILRFISLL